MSEFQRIRRQQMLREAEGYLDLITALPAPPRRDIRDGIAQRSLKILEQLAEDGRRRAQVLYLRGRAFQAMEQYVNAVSELERAADIDRENIHIYLALGWCQKRSGRVDKAIEALERALSVERSEPIIYYNLACYWSLARNPKLALAYLSRAFELDPAYRDLVGSERDFDPIRKHPGFVSLTSVIV